MKVRLSTNLQFSKILEFQKFHEFSMVTFWTFEALS